MIQFLTYFISDLDICVVGYLGIKGRCTELIFATNISLNTFCEQAHIGPPIYHRRPDTNSAGFLSILPFVETLHFLTCLLSLRSTHCELLPINHWFLSNVCWRPWKKSATNWQWENKSMIYILDANAKLSHLKVINFLC